MNDIVANAMLPVRLLYALLKNRTTYLKKELHADETEAGNNNFQLMNYSNNEDIHSWCKLINSSYYDANYSEKEARNMLTNHPFVENSRTAFYVINGEKVATISYGIIKGTKDVGGFFRIAVHPDYQGKGFGRVLLVFAENEVRKLGAISVEEAIKLARVPSLLMHFNAGYLPEKSPKERACPRDKDRYIYKDRILNFITRGLYKSYQKMKGQ